jgi:hypothetical protein
VPGDWLDFCTTTVWVLYLQLAGISVSLNFLMTGQTENLLTRIYSIPVADLS